MINSAKIRYVSAKSKRAVGRRPAFSLRNFRNPAKV
jgi:hypothetical protein